MPITDAQFDELKRIIRWRLRSFSKRNDFEDLLQVAYLAAWEDILRCHGHPRFNLKHIGVQRAVWEVLTYVKKAKRIWDAERPLEYETTNEEGEELNTELLTQPDFTPTVHDRMEAAHVLRGLTDSELEILTQYHVEGMTFQEIADAHGKRSKTWGFNQVRAAEKKVRATSQETPLACRL